MDPISQHIATLLERRVFPAPSLPALLADLRREGRALTTNTLLRVVEGDRGEMTILRPWQGRLAPLAPEEAPPQRVRERTRGPFAGAARRPTLTLTRGGAAARSLPATISGEPEGTVLVVGAPPRPDGDVSPPSFVRVARAVVKLAHRLDQDSLVDRVRWLQLHVQVRQLAA